jgi:hypothetical protein
VVFDKAGNLYGATMYGGSSACPPGWCGTVYELSPPQQKGGNWTEQVLHIFRGYYQGDGASPSGGLIMDSAGNLYEVAAYGGSAPCILFATLTGCGAVYELSPPQQQGGAWTETTLSDPGYVTKHVTTGGGADVPNFSSLRKDWSALADDLFWQTQAVFHLCRNSMARF